MPTRESRQPEPISTPAILVTQSERQFYLCRLTAEVLSKITYVAVRGQSSEDGAVQRILNPRRIASLKNYALNRGDYPACIVLNWVSQTSPLEYVDGNLRLYMEDRAAQIIDGQHRVEGLKEAIGEDAEVGLIEVPVAIYNRLDTRGCADIFLSINTEQKPVPRSLVFDLYGVASEALVDFSTARAKDVAIALNEEDSSPYNGLIRLPGPRRQKGGVALSTAVSAIKPFVSEKGLFAQEGIDSLIDQTRVFLNYTNTLRSLYAESWENPDNACLYAAGFSGAVDFLRTHLFEYCLRRRSFESETMERALGGLKDSPIFQSELKGLGGAKSRRRVEERLIDAFNPEHDDDRTIAF